MEVDFKDSFAPTDAPVWLLDRNLTTYSGPIKSHRLNASASAVRRARNACALKDSTGDAAFSHA
ncbi:MAG: hypothetical protein ACJA0Z_004186 [Halioglobus sp.]|jgi:hypothetical protein